MEDVRGSLDILAGLYAFAAPAGPHSLVLAGHCLSCAAALRAKHAGRKAKYLVGFLIVFLGGFGGSVVAGLLIQRPDLSPNPAFKDWRILPFTVVAWYLFEYTQLGDLLFRIPLVPSLCKCVLKILARCSLCLAPAIFIMQQKPITYHHPFISYSTFRHDPSNAELQLLMAPNVSGKS